VIESEGGVRVLQKAAGLLDDLAEGGELTAADLAQRADEPRSTVYRLLATLESLEFVEPGTARGTYRLGLKLFRLGSAVSARFDERQAALAVMERIHEQTGETVFLCVRRGSEAVCIERFDGHRVQSLALRLGGSLPLHAGAAPRALLAYEPRAVWDWYAANCALVSLVSDSTIPRERLFAELEEVLMTGVAVSDEDVTPGIAALGAPILDHGGSIRAALSISGLREAILGESAARVRALIVEGGHEISAALGYTASAQSEHG
jgi:DNA-binding IclR family transcriptional regulator